MEENPENHQPSQETGPEERKKENRLKIFYKKHRKGLTRTFWVLLVIAAYLVGATGLLPLPNTVTIINADREFTSSLRKIGMLESYISNSYLRDFDREEMSDNMIKAMFDSLSDKYSVYYDPNEFSAMQSQLEGTFTGIAVYLNMTDPGHTVIESVIEGGPADQAGLQKGDEIVKIDGEDVTGEEYEQLLSKITGEDGSKVKITVLRDGEEQEFTVTRGEVNQQTVAERNIDGIGYIFLQQFGKGTTDEFEKAVQNLEGEGVKALIIDLRYNGGGLLNTAVDIADYLLPEGEIGSLKDNGGVVQSFDSDSKAIDLPFVVLVNGNSASASEFLAGNIQQFGGTVIGETTYGKGVAQSYSGLSDGSGFKLTTEEYFVGEDVPVNQKGVTPDIAVSTDKDILYTGAEDLSEDLQLQKALEVLNSGQEGKVTGQSQ